MSEESRQLLLESRKGLAKEYRIADGRVEVRTLDCGADHGNAWSRLTPEQLSTHVKRNTVVARWLERRLGWRHLLQACVGQEPSMWTGAQTAN